MTLTDYYKYAAFSFSAAKKVAPIAAGLGALRGALSPRPNESRIESVMKDGILLGLLGGAGAGLMSGTISKITEKFKI